MGTESLPVDDKSHIRVFVCIVKRFYNDINNLKDMIPR